MRHTLHRRNKKYHRNQFEEHLADIKYHRDKPVHSIQNVRVKGLMLLFTDNARCMKGMEYYLIEGRKEMFYLTTHSTHFIYGYMASEYLIEKLSSEQPGGINEKEPFKYYSSYMEKNKLKCSIHVMFLRLNHWFILSYFQLLHTLTSYYVFRYN